MHLLFIVDLDSKVAEIMGESVNHSTRDTYSRVINQFENFLVSIDLGPVNSSSWCLTNIMRWLASLHQQGRAASTIMSAISALKYHANLHRLNIPWKDAQFCMFTAGLKRTSPSQTRLAISTAELAAMQDRCSQLFPLELAVTLKAVLSIAFYGFLRPGEVCNSKAGHTLRRADVELLPTHLLITFYSYKHSKGDKKTIKVEETKESTCPVKSVSEYIKLVPRQPEDSLFPMSVSSFSHLFKQVKKAAGLPPNLSPHCLRHGGATWASNKGWSATKIQAHGRWSSDAYKVYISPF